MPTADSSALAPDPATTLVILLGAGTYPRKEMWSNPVLATSARAVHAYLTSPRGMAIPELQVLSLFDDPRPAVEQLRVIRRFLGDPSRQDARDLLVYYIGHGGFDEDNYYIAVRDTTEDDEFMTAMKSEWLSRVVMKSFNKKRVYVVFDSCFAASASENWMAAGDLAGELGLAMAKMSTNWPAAGTAFLAAASKKNVAIAARDSTYTMFTGAVLQALERGVKNAEPRLSLSELHQLIRTELDVYRGKSGSAPELHAPKQTQGNVSLLPLFPNHGYRAEAPLLSPPPPDVVVKETSDMKAGLIEPNYDTVDGSLLPSYRMPAVAAVVAATAIVSGFGIRHVLRTPTDDPPPSVIPDAHVVAVQTRTAVEQVLDLNPFIEHDGHRWLSHQVTGNEYALILSSFSADEQKQRNPRRPGPPDGPVAWVTCEDAIAFCDAIGAGLPISREWAPPPPHGGAPLREWTAPTKRGDIAAVMRGGSNDGASLATEAMYADDRPAMPDVQVSAADLGFRCVR